MELKNYLEQHVSIQEEINAIEKLKEDILI